MIDFTSVQSPVPIMKIIADEIAEAIFPFKPGMVTAEYKNTFDGSSHILHVTTSNFCDEEVNVNLFPLYLMHDERTMAELIGKKAGEYFRSLQNKSAPENVQLGEN